MKILSSLASLVYTKLCTVRDNLAPSYSTKKRAQHRAGLTQSEAGQQAEAGLPQAEAKIKTATSQESRILQQPIPQMTIASCFGRFLSLSFFCGARTERKRMMILKTLEPQLAKLCKDEEKN
jgi:hypothetical protein